MNKDGKSTYLWVLLGSLLIGIFFVVGCQPQPPNWLEPLPTTTSVGSNSPHQHVSIFFTSPANDEYRGGPDRHLVDALDKARSQIDAAVYDLNLWSVRNALIRAHQRGVQVRLVVEWDSLARPEIQELIDAGIPTVPDEGEGLMHNKFFIIDGAEVWTGSMNLTINGAYRHLNNLVKLRSNRLAENYTVEFEEMFLEGYFGETVLENTPHPSLTLDGVTVETYFSPDDNTGLRLLELILSAENSIDFMVYSFTSDSMAEAILLKASQGIQVRGVLDTYQEGAGFGGEYQRFQNQGLDVYLDAHPEKLHHKVMIIDQEIVVTGSYNLTRSAEVLNDENTLIIHDREIAEIFLNEFEWIYEDAASR